MGADKETAIEDDKNDLIGLYQRYFFIYTFECLNAIVMNKNFFFSYICYFLLITSYLLGLSSCRQEPEPCIGPTPHIPDWIQSKYSNIQIGDSVKFTYTGEDLLSEEMGIEWEFQGAYPLISNDPVVWAIYNSPGCWDVTLTMRPNCSNKEQPFKKVAPSVCVEE